MTYLFIDTCVYLNLATDIKLYEIIEKLIDLETNGKIKIIVPDIVMHELKDHEEKIIAKRISSYKGHLKNLTNLFDLFTPTTVKTLKGEIQEINKNLSDLESVLKKNMNSLLEIINKSSQIIHTEKHKNNVIDRGINKVFPFHRNKNSIKDGLIAELFIEFISCLPKECERIYFITDNTEDFSDINNKTLPHNDWKDYFKAPIYYSTNIATVINEISPDSINKEIEQEIKEKIDNDICIDGSYHEFDIENGLWFRSMYGAGLSWHYRCKKCGKLYDTGEFWD